MAATSSSHFVFEGRVEGDVDEGTHAAVDVDRDH
jgi:hypothetical protein